MRWDIATIINTKIDIPIDAPVNNINDNDNIGLYINDIAELKKVVQIENTSSENFNLSAFINPNSLIEENNNIISTLLSEQAQVEYVSEAIIQDVEEEPRIEVIVENSAPFVEETPLQDVEELSPPIVEEVPLQVVEEMSPPIVEEVPLQVVEEVPLQVVEEVQQEVVEEVVSQISTEEETM